MGLSVIIITKNEAHDLPRALASVSFADEVIVLDSGSTDGTQKIARDWGAIVHETAEWPGFGVQKNRALDKATQDWVLSLDADECIEPTLAREIKDVITGRFNRCGTDVPVVAFCLRRRSVYIDRVIQYGDWRHDRVVRLFRRESARFTNDLVHERLSVNGRIAQLTGFMSHFSVLSIEDSRSKMRNYSQLAAFRIARDGRGGVIKGFFKAVFTLFRGLVLRAGFLDGLRGLQLAWFNALGTYRRYALAQNIQDEEAYTNGTQSPWQRFRDALQLIFNDHGFLRVAYHNRHCLAGGLYRTNQPSPKRLALYKKKYGIRTVINLRGKNIQLGWYRLEEKACKELGLKLVNTQLYSRGLVSGDRLAELAKIIEDVELPAVVHCKSGADRAGFFSAIYRHHRLGEPIESCASELAIKYGHFKWAKTGILDYFFWDFLQTRKHRESFSEWVRQQYNGAQLQSDFSSNSKFDFVVDKFLRRE